MIDQILAGMSLMDEAPNGMRSRSMALGRTWTLLGSRKNSQPENCLKTATNPRPAVRLAPPRRRLPGCTSKTVAIATCAAEPCWALDELKTRSLKKAIVALNSFHFV